MSHTHISRWLWSFSIYFLWRGCCYMAYQVYHDRFLLWHVFLVNLLNFWYPDGVCLSNLEEDTSFIMSFPLVIHHLCSVHLHMADSIAVFPFCLLSSKPLIPFWFSPLSGLFLAHSGYHLTYHILPHHTISCTLMFAIYVFLFFIFRVLLCYVLCVNYHWLLSYISNNECLPSLDLFYLI